jgi:uncharacterized membrane protein YfcA
MTWDASHLGELFLIGIAVGAINSAGGGGGLLVFPALIAFGVPALTANHTNTVAQTPSYVAIAVGYRRELADQRSRITHLVPAVLIGAGAGVAVLELAPAGAFTAIAPALVAFGSLLLAFQPRINRFVRARAPTERPHRHLTLAVAVTGAYAAYFGVAAGVLMLGVLAIAITDTMQRVNALNRLLIAVANVLATVVFIVVGPVSWPPVAVLIPATIIGGWFGVSVVRRLDPGWLRALHLVIGAAASGYMIAVTWL